MTGSWEPFSNVDRNCRIRPWATFFASTEFHLPGNAGEHDWRDFITSHMAVFCRLPHDRSADVSRSDHLLHAVLPARGYPACKTGRTRRASQRSVDNAHGSQRDRRESVYLRQHRYRSRLAVLRRFVSAGFETARRNRGCFEPVLTCSLVRPIRQVQKGYGDGPGRLL